MTSALAQPTRPSTAPTRLESAVGPPPDDELRGLYHDHHAALLAFAMWFTHDHAAAEDAVQETFLRAWRHLPRLLADGRPLRAWLRQVLRRVIIDNARAAKAHPVTLVADSSADGAVDGGYDLLLDRGVLTRAVRQLPLAQQQVLVEIYFNDAPAQRVADRLGIPAATVRSRLHYALRSLRRLLEDQDLRPIAS